MTATLGRAAESPLRARVRPIADDIPVLPGPLKGATMPA